MVGSFFAAFKTDYQWGGDYYIEAYLQPFICAFDIRVFLRQHIKLFLPFRTDESAPQIDASAVFH